jgi:threonine/homoserine/homoserine lactone efflux protein
MIINFIAGIVTGFIVSIPPFGPIAFAVISKGFGNEIKEGRAIAFGAAFMDFVYCLIAFAGITLFVSIFPAVVSEFYSGNILMIKMALTFIGCIIVILYGIKIMKSRITYSKMESEDSEKLNSALAKASKLSEKAKDITKLLKIPEKIKESNMFGLFFMGVLLCMSSLTLPASWIFVIGYLKGFDFLDSSFAGGFLFSAGSFLGTLSWYYVLVKLISRNSRRINQSTVNKLNIIAGTILLMLGIFLFIKAAALVFYI